MLDVLALSAKFAYNRWKAAFIDCAKGVCGKAQCDESCFICEPQPFFLQIRLETAFCNSCDFKTNSLFLFCDPAERIRITANWLLSSHLTYLGHDYYS